MSRAGKIFLAAGILVITAALAVWLTAEIRVRYRYENAAYYVEKLISVMPERTEGIPEARSGSGTATYELDGLSFAGIIEMPDYMPALPVYGGWDTSKLPVFPCLFSGSADNSDLIIGSTSDKDLFPFVRRISANDRIIFTDMTGVRFTYYITNIRHAKSAGMDVLTKDESDFVLFIKDRTALDYVVISAGTESAHQ